MGLGVHYFQTHPFSYKQDGSIATFDSQLPFPACTGGSRLSSIPAPASSPEGPRGPPDPGATGCRHALWNPAGWILTFAPKGRSQGATISARDLGVGRLGWQGAGRCFFGRGSTKSCWTWRLKYDEICWFFFPKELISCWTSILRSQLQCASCVDIFSQVWRKGRDTSTNSPLNWVKRIFCQLVPVLIIYSSLNPWYSAMTTLW